MRYFIPEWDDQVDPNYNFIIDKHSPEHNYSRRSDAYMWEIFEPTEIPFDGILTSLMNLVLKKNMMRL